MINHKALKEIVHRFDENKIVWGLGGSCMMYLQGIDVDPRDIDLIVIPQDFALALRILNESGTFQQSGPQGIFASELYAHGTFMGSDVDLIAGFCIIKADKIITYPFDIDRIALIDYDKRMIPCCRLEDWILLYDAMEKYGKVEMIRLKCSQISFAFDIKDNQLI